MTTNTGVSVQSSDLCFISGRELAELIRARKLSAREVMAAYLRQIGRVNPKVNAIVAKLDDAKCLALADEADRRIGKGERVGLLHGLPMAFKDTEAAVDFPFTRGSPIFKDDLPTEDTIVVERMRNAGVVPIGKTNVPEFGMGSHTYNRVYGTTVNQPLDRDLKGVRVAWCPDLGVLPLDRRVRSVLEAQRMTFEDLGCIVEDACPDLSGADEVFLTIRAWRSWHTLGSLLERHRAEMKPEAVSEIEYGARLSGSEIGFAMVRHGEIMERMRKFQERYKFTFCAVNQVPPFDATIDWPKSIEATTMEHYIAWMKSAYWITVTFRPAISVPAGFTPEGLPVGIQIVGRYRDDLGVLQVAHAFEKATGFGQRRPAIALS